MRLQHLCKDAGPTGRELSARCGWHPAETTRIPKGAALPSDTDIRAWCTACGADDQDDDSMYLEWRRLHRSGMRHVQRALDCLLAGAHLEDLVQAPAYWQPGWEYPFPPPGQPGHSTSDVARG